MNYIVIDLEFNQSFDFKTGAKSPSNPLLPLEIIQIGAVKLDSRLNFVDRFGTTVRPRLYRGLNPFVAKVTGLSKDTLRNSPSFAAAYRGLVNFIGKEQVTLCFWGNDDMRELFRNILYCKQSTRPLPLKYINVQSLASLHQNLPASQQVALCTIVDTLGIRADMPFHSAPNDAYYTAEVFKKIYDKDRINLLTFDLAKLKERNASILEAMELEKLETKNEETRNQKA